MNCVHCNAETGDVRVVCTVSLCSACAGTMQRHIQRLDEDLGYLRQMGVEAIRVAAIEGRLQPAGTQTEADRDVFKKLLQVKWGRK
jgi:hypothetical protein